MIAPEFSTHARQAIGTTREMIDQFGPRLAGSQSCLDTAKALQRDLQAVCGQADLESFTAHPGAFLSFLWLEFLTYVAGVVLLCLDFPILAALTFTLMLVIGYLEFGLYKEFVDPAFPQRDCTNLVATLEPEGKATQQVILSGHHDSALESRWLRYCPRLYPVVILVPDVFYHVALLFSWLLVFYKALTGHELSFALAATGFLVLGIPFVMTRFFSCSRKGTPGAGDNLIASTMLAELARMFVVPSRPGKNSLDHTRLILVSFDAEESGLRGSRAFVRSHRSELQTLPTYMFNMDAIYEVDKIQFLTSDLNGTVPLSRELAELCARLSAEIGYSRKLTPMIFGGGACDSAELARVGVQATTLVAMPTNVIRDHIVYHTQRDTVDAIEIEAVEACLCIAHKLVLALDRDGTSPLKIAVSR